jgi:flagellar hook-basal body complex protein FliE
MAIESLGARTVLPLAPAASAASTTAAAAPAAGFGESLHKLLTSVEESAGDANDAVAGMIDGSKDVHHAMIALQKAEMALQLTVQLRNKFVQAYQDVMRMPV